MTVSRNLALGTPGPDDDRPQDPAKVFAASYATLEAERDRLRDALRRWMVHDHSAQVGPDRPVNGCERCRWEAEGLL